MTLKKAALTSCAVLLVSVAVPLCVLMLGQRAESIASGQDNTLAGGAAFRSYSFVLPQTESPSPQLPGTGKRTPLAGRLASFPTGGLNMLDIFTAQSEKESHIGAEIPTPLPSEEVLSALPYDNDSTAQDGIITRYTFTDGDSEQFFSLKNGSQVRNCTDYDNGFLYDKSLMGADFSLKCDGDKPLVLIYHTHATESFEQTERDSYDRNFSCKTTERKLSIISVGDEICKALTENGVSVLHDTLVHDYPSYDAAYGSSRATVSELLEKYPSIKIVLDIHRDGIERESGERLAPCFEVGDKTAAQIMIIACAGDGELDVPDHISNFRFACALQEQIELDYPDMCRPMLFDYRFYNQDLSHGCLLIEVGSQANSIDEVRLTGRLLGEEIAKLTEK